LRDSALLHLALLSVHDELCLRDMKVQLVIFGLLQSELFAFELKGLLQGELLL
jgi:hypothetical protein